MISVTHFRAADPAFADQARAALQAMAARPGYLRGSVGRSTDDAAAWVLVSEWESVGAYRRALGAYDVKVHATPLLAQAEDRASSFEQLVEVRAGGKAMMRGSDLAADA